MILQMNVGTVCIIVEQSFGLDFYFDRIFLLKNFFVCLGFIRTPLNHNVHLLTSMFKNLHKLSSYIVKHYM